MLFLLLFLLFLTIYLTVLGTVTMLLAWLISGHRTTVWNAIKANIFWVITLAFTTYGASSSINAIGHGHQLPLFVLLALGATLFILGFIVIPCWVFARYLEINTLQAFAVLLLLSVLSSILGIVADSRLPADMRARIPHTQFTQATTPAQESLHV